MRMQMQMQMEIPPIPVPMTSIQSCDRCLSLPPIPSCQRLKISFSVQGHTVLTTFMQFNSVNLSSSLTIPFQSHSYFSPLLKSIPFSNTTQLQRSMIGVDLSTRLQFIEALESRFFFLAADARSTLRFFFIFYSLTLNINLTSSFLFQGLEAIL